MKRFLVLLCVLIFGSADARAESGPEYDVIVVGGGIAGMSAAYKLKEAGLSIKLLEMKPRLGGRIQTVRFPGYTVEAGLAEFWSENPALELIKRFKLPTEESVAFSSVVIDGKLYSFMQDTTAEYLEYLLGKSQYEAFKRWNSTMEGLYRQLSKRPLSKELLALKDISFADWVTKNSKLGDRALKFIGTTVGVETGTSWKSFSALDGIDEWALFFGEGQIPHEIKGGNQRLVEEIAKFIGEENYELNRQVKSIRQDDQRVTVDALDTAHYEPVQYRARYLISTIPLYRLLFDVAFHPPLPENVQRAIQTQTWGSYCNVFVHMDPEASDLWTDEEASALPILTDSPLGVIYDGNANAEEGEEKILSLLTTGSYAERYNLMPQDLTEKEIRKAFEELWPGSTKYIRKMELHRQHPRAIAAWPVGRSRFDGLSDAVRAPHGRVFLAGDFTENSHSSGAVASGFRSAKAIVTLVEASHSKLE